MVKDVDGCFSRAQDHVFRGGLVLVKHTKGCKNVMFLVGDPFCLFVVVVYRIEKMFFETTCHTNSFQVFCER